MTDRIWLAMAEDDNENLVLGAYRTASHACRAVDTWLAVAKPKSRRGDWFKEGESFWARVSETRTHLFVYSVEIED